MNIDPEKEAIQQLQEALARVRGDLPPGEKNGCHGRISWSARSAWPKSEDHGC